MWRDVALLLLTAASTAALLVILGSRATGLPPLGMLLDPLDGLYRTARLADAPAPERLTLSGLRQPVQIEWDDRGVPHIFAENDLDAVRALGYAVARDRLFQLDFLPRAASGRLAEALGPAAVPADRFLRSTGMDWGARRNLARIREENGEELALIEAYADGVNAFIDGLGARDLPFEFRLLGYKPDRWTPLRSLRLLQYMNYDLTYRTDDPSYHFLRQRLTAAEFDLLYPPFDGIYVPIIPSEVPDAEASLLSNPPEGGLRTNMRTTIRTTVTSSGSPATAIHATLAKDTPAARSGIPDAGSGLLRAWPLLRGFVPGKGSNNWAVSPDRSTTGHAILAGDMHLSVTLPAIWYEVHIVTPGMNSYGVTIPGAPLPVEAFNSHVAWAFTNAGSDQIDHYGLEMDSSRTRYRFDGAWRDLDLVLDTIRVNRGADVVDTLRYSHLGPVVEHAGRAVALKWTAHEPSRTLAALLGMNRATDVGAFQRALESWDTPMQNILYADADGTIAIRSTGHLPVRRGGRGDGLLDGTTSVDEWIGRVPFDELPTASNPPQGFLTSTNQRPVDSTYSYYVGADWRDQYRSLRIDSLLRRKTRHSVEDVARYQSDVHAVQYDLFFPLIDTLRGLSPSADQVVEALREWDGSMVADRPEPILLDYFLQELARLSWDEAAFRPVQLDGEGDSLDAPVHVPMPSQSRLLMLLRDRPDLRWFDILHTPEREGAAGLLRAAVEATVDRLSTDLPDGVSVPIGDGSEELRWGRHRKIEFRHLIGSPVFKPFGRGPFEFSGYRETLSPASSPISTHSASWRVVVDFASGVPQGRGVYPGGQRGSPFSRHYDAHLGAYLNFEYFDLLKPRAPEELDGAHRRSTTVLLPAESPN